MPIPVSRKHHLQSLGLPSDTETIRRARVFMLRAGLTISELADMAAINPSSLRVFLSGAYDRHHGAESNTLNIRAALKQVIDIHEIATMPATSGPHYDTAEYSAVRHSMWSALRQGTAFLVDGPPGTQKTYTFRRVAEEINRSGEGRAVYIYSRIDHSPQSFLVEACTEAGIPNRGTIDQLIRKLRFFLGSQRALLIVDEGQHLNSKGLEILRQLLDTPPYFGVVLGGSHDLSKTIAVWQMEQWRSRLRRTHLLAGLTQAEAAHILTAELGPMRRSDVTATIKDAEATAKRWEKRFDYISARNLFFAIEDARAALQTPAPDAQVSEPVVVAEEAIA